MIKIDNLKVKDGRVEVNSIALTGNIKTIIGDLAVISNGILEKIAETDGMPPIDRLTIIFTSILLTKNGLMSLEQLQELFEDDDDDEEETEGMN